MRRFWQDGRFETFDDIDRNGLFDEAFYTADMDTVFRTDQRDGQSATSGTAGTSDPVDVVFSEFRQVVIENMRDGRDIDAACCHVCCDKNPDFSAAQAFQRAVAHALRHIAMQGGCRKTGDGKPVGDLIGFAFGCGKDQRLFERAVFQPVIQQAVFVFGIVHEVEHLVDVFVAGGR